MVSIQEEYDMQTARFNIIKYAAEYEEKWDKFVEIDSLNGTFLQSRRFLNYHKEGKFVDSSLLFYEEQELVAVCPACVKEEMGKKIFVSHSGSTYGGIILSHKIMRTYKVLSLLDCLECWLKENGFSLIILKQTNPLLCKQKTELLDFCLYYKKYVEYKELNLYIDYEKINKDNIISNFTKLKKRIVKKCVNEGMVLSELFEREELERFLEILELNLKKYNLKPYHTVEDFLELKTRFPEDIRFWGCIFHNEIVAVAMTFYFKNSKCVHTHYLAADPKYNKKSPMTFVYYKMIEIFNNQECCYLSWGITTEHLGLELNSNLTNSKEGFGSSHNVVSVYQKEVCE